MKLISRRRAIGLSVVICIGLTGCAGLLQETPPARAYFTIDPGESASVRSTEATTKPSSRILRVRTLRVSAPYDGVVFIYRIGPSQFDRDYYNNFIAPPASLLTGSLIRWFEQRGKMTVCDASSDLQADFDLEGNITALYIDSTAASPTAFLSARFFLTRDREQAMPVFERSYEESAAVTARTPAAFAAAWGEAYRKMLVRLAKDVESAANRR